MSPAALAIAPAPESEPTSTALAEAAPRGKPGPKPGGQTIARTKRTSGEAQRFFLAKGPNVNDTLELGEEVGSESEALVRAFRSEHGTFYKVEACRAEIEMQGENPVIVKKPAAR